MNSMDVLDLSGHLTLSWDPDDPESVTKAKEEFDRLKAAGYAFFATQTATAAVVRLKKKALEQRGSLDVRPELIKEFQPRARRTTAVRPMRGG